MTTSERVLLYYQVASGDVDNAETTFRLRVLLHLEYHIRRKRHVRRWNRYSL